MRGHSEKMLATDREEGPHQNMPRLAPSLIPDFRPPEL